MEQARKADAVIAKQPQDTFWGGYAGYFEDPDRHLWEIVWNPPLPTSFPLSLLLQRLRPYMIEGQCLC